MNIFNYYRKGAKKSRSFKEYLKDRWVNVSLFIAAIAVIALIAVYQTCRIVSQPKRIDISISPQSIDLFGSDTIDALIQEFEKQNPNLRVLIPLESNDPPGGADIVFFDDDEFSSLLNESALASLTPYIHIDVQAEQEAAHRALPLVSFMDIFVYNIDILEAAGCDRPPKTRAEFLAAARAVAGAASSQEGGQESIFPFALSLSQTDPTALRRDFYPWLWANGGDIQSIDISNENITLPRVFTDTIAFLGQLDSEGLLAPDTFEKNSTQRLEEFAEGKIAMMLASARDIAFLRSNIGITFGITSVPAAALGKNHLGLSGIYAGMNSACTLPDEAWLFLAFIAEKKHILAETLGAVPGAAHDSAYPGEYIAQDPLYIKAWDIFEAAEIVEYMPGSQNEEEVNRLIWEKLIEAFK